MSKYRQTILDHGTALQSADLCLLNLDKIRECWALAARESALWVATHQYRTVRRYALDVLAWCRRCGLDTDTRPLYCAIELRRCLREARRAIDHDLD